MTDNIARDKLSIKYCPTDDMLADYYTKPVQGSKCRKFRQRILNLPSNPIVRPQECVVASPYAASTRQSSNPTRMGTPSRERKTPVNRPLTAGKENDGGESSNLNNEHTSLNVNINNRRASIAKLLGKRSYIDVLKTGLPN